MRKLLLRGLSFAVIAFCGVSRDAAATEQLVSCEGVPYISFCHATQCPWDLAGMCQVFTGSGAGAGGICYQESGCEGLEALVNWEWNSQTWTWTAIDPNSSSYTQYSKIICWCQA